LSKTVPVTQQQVLYSAALPQQRQMQCAAAAAGLPQMQPPQGAASVILWGCPGV